MNDMPHHHHSISRRGILGGSAAMLALSGGLRVAFGADVPVALGGAGTTGGSEKAAAGSPILVVIFCRFGQDGLQLVAPSGDPNYIAARPTIRIGASSSFGLGTLDGVDMYFNTNMPELKALYDAKQLATVVAAGDSAAVPRVPAATGVIDATVRLTITEAQRRYQAAIDAQRKGDWARYGEEIKQLGVLLERLGARPQ